MFFLRQPSEEAIRRFISSQCELPFSYPEVGATAGELPGGYLVDRNRIKLGTGKETYERASAALRNWQQFDLGWVRMVPAETPIEVGAVVAILTRHFGFWSLNACRVVYLIDEDGPLKKFGFAYGTLSSHVERGEERFTIELHETNDSVWYDILAFSRPNQFMVSLGFPLARRLQKRFARDSLAAMLAKAKE
ncbi:MAG: DUF1990 domain-containing protein [Pyrinomonadaceae bacterium]|nr:DUF1990 domain-containing protein [Pyrinomonadaceae bacterium]